MAKRQNYSQEYKLKVVKLLKAVKPVVEQDQSPAKVAGSPGVSAGNLRRWVRQQEGRH